MSTQGTPGPYAPCLDHDAFWGDSNDLMKERTKIYAERAQQVVEERFLLEHIWHPWRQDTDYTIDSDIRIFEMVGDHCELPNGPQQFDDPRDLLMYWESSPKDITPEKTNRRVIIIKDMHPRLIELLGVLLEIPPEFFLAHCEEFAGLSVVNTSGAPQGSSTYWKVPVPRRFDIPADRPPQTPKGTSRVKLGNFNRGGLNLTPDKKWLNLTSFVSYWGKPYGDDSWTAVLLIDPDVCNLKYETMFALDSETTLELVDCESLRDITREFRLGSSFDETIRQHTQPVFDTVVQAYDNYDFEHSSDPFSATVFVRNLVRSIWGEFTMREATKVHDIQFDDEQEQTKSNLHRDLTSREIHHAPSYEKYQELMEKRQTIREKKRDLQNIMWSFRCRQPPEPLIEHGQKKKKSAKQEKLKPQTQGEHESWRILEETLEAAEVTLGNHMEMFAQRSALVQAEAANRMARSSGQLTKIATIIVPCSFVASIFSMGGDFAAGEKFFFVYWTISLPITFLLLRWVFYKDEDTIKFFGTCKQMFSEILGKVGKLGSSSRSTGISQEGEGKGGLFKRRPRQQGLEDGQL